MWERIHSRYGGAAENLYRLYQPLANDFAPHSSKAAPYLKNGRDHSAAGCTFGRRTTARSNSVGGVSQLILRPSFSSMDGS